MCDARQSRASTLEGMSSLVDKSLVQPADEAQGEPRFQMLETVREYAIERLDASGEHPVRGAPTPPTSSCWPRRDSARSRQSSARRGCTAVSGSTTIFAPRSTT